MHSQDLGPAMRESAAEERLHRLETAHRQQAEVDTRAQAAQDARDRLAEHTFTLLAGIANRVQALDDREVRAIGAGSIAVEDLRTATGRQPDGRRA